MSTPHPPADHPRRAGTWLDRLNARHPWNHNDAFLPWVLTRLPVRRDRALDVGCGRGELAALLAQRFEHVHGTDIHPAMREAATRRCAGLPNVTIDDGHLGELAEGEGVDLVTMVAVLHHLDLDEALRQVAAILRPGGRFLCVGLARPASPSDLAWEAASVVTNPVIGYVRHPWVSQGPPPWGRVPMADPAESVGEIRRAAQGALPGARIRRQLGFRYTLEWAKPEVPGP